MLLRYASVKRIPQRELRNDVSAVLRRVVAGEQLRVTISGHDVADLVPIEDTPLDWRLASAGADHGRSSRCGPGS